MNAHFIDDRIELLTVAEMRAADAFAISSGTPGIELMEAAGRAVADEAAAMARDASALIVVLCGPGNNGGDGFVAARLLAERGFRVELSLLGTRERLKGDAALAAAQWSGSCGRADEQRLDGAALVIDALFGAGLDRDLQGAARALVDRVNVWRAAGRGLVLAVDAPSGLDGDTGLVRGVAIQADASVTFHRLKPGHLLFPGRALCGRTVCADIGISPDALSAVRPQLSRNLPALWRSALPPPAVDGHKYTRGHALILSGEAHRTGAARLAARGALRGGAGLVTVASPRSALAVNAGRLTAIMLAPCDGAGELGQLLLDPRLNAVVLGPGGGIGQAMREVVFATLGSGEPGRGVVLDADALTSFESRGPELAQAVRMFPGGVMLTPHEGEFARLFRNFDGIPHVDSQALQAPSKLVRARAAARITGAIVLLKGPDTVAAHPDGRATIASDLPPWLATAGSGDVLAGLVAACLARGAPAFEAASAAVWLHGAAARAFGPGLIAEDLPEMMPKVWAALYGA
jgi:hydroxyethylthiazole kinase-like uncharacterized protein yjeF